MLAKINPLSVPVFEKLADYADQLSELTLHDLFSNDADRFKKFSHQLGNIFIDYSKNHIDEELMTLLISWAESIGFDQCKNALFNGQPINEKEQRAVLHNALRNPDDYDFELNGVPIQKAVKKDYYFTSWWFYRFHQVRFNRWFFNCKKIHRPFTFTRSKTIKTEMV